MAPRSKSAEKSLQLVERIGRGEGDALGELYDEFAPLLLALSRKILWTKEEAEDVVQEVFVQVWNQANRLGTVFMNPTVGSWVMTAENLRPAPRGQLYHVWFVVGGQNELARTFQVDERARIEIGSDNLPRDLSAILVTIEPDAAPNDPAGPAILYGDEQRLVL